MPLEFKRFESIDRSFRNTMDAVQKQSKLWEFIESDKLRQEFGINNK
jgi:hypothetical protein